MKLSKRKAQAVMHCYYPTDPIVRIYLFELHIGEPEYYDHLYYTNPELHKRAYSLGQQQHVF